MAKTSSDELTDQQRIFCQEYLKDLNAKQAAIRAGYSEKTAEMQASRLLARNPAVQAHIQKLMTERAKRTAVDADRVLLEIERLAMFDPRDLTEVRGPQDIAELPEDVRRAIVGWGWDKRGNFTVKFVKEKALELLGRHHKLFIDKLEVSGEVDIAERIRKARERSKIKPDSAS